MDNVVNSIVESDKGITIMPKQPAKKNNAAPKETNELESKNFQFEIQKLRLEEDRSWFEFHKHMTTLNTGVIIIIATLLEKVFTNTGTDSFQTISMSFFAFLGSITMSVIGLGYHMPSLRLVRSQGTGKGSRSIIYLLKYAKVFLFITSLTGFLLGIIFFVIFALGNTR